ncbi:hypothetical protein V6N13_003413 [Hibiscus sabdariffa]
MRQMNFLLEIETHMTELLDNHVDHIKHGLPIEIPKDNDSLIEVLIRCDLETSKDSSGSSKPRALTLDKETGLFSIKSKGIKNISVWNTNLSRPKLDRLQAKSSRNNIPNKSRLGKSIEKVPSSIVSPTKAKVRKDSTPDRSYEEAIAAEASTTLEVCNLAGIHFAVSNEMVCSRLVQLVTDNSDLE